MKFDVDDKNRCRLVCVKFYLNRCRFAVAVAKCLGVSLFWGHSVDTIDSGGRRAQPQQMRAVPRCQQTSEAEHRLVHIYIFIRINCNFKKKKLKKAMEK